MALRSAISLGINLRLVNDKIDDASKEARGRLWWSIYSLEHLLTSMNGRASYVGENLCSVPLPIPAEEESFDQPDIRGLFEDITRRKTHLCPTLFETSSQLQGATGTFWTSELPPSPSLFFLCLVDLSLITQAVINQIYSIEGIRQGTSQTEYLLQKHGLRFDRWLHKLPTCYRFTLPNADPWHIDHTKLDDEAFPHTRERVSLALNYYSARITLCRPCLTQTHTAPNTASPQDPNTRAKLRAAIATECLQAACCLTSILPDSTDVNWLARIAPCWSILHFLMQATTALLLGISYCSFVSPPGTTPPLYQSQSPTAPGTPNPSDPSFAQHPPLLNTDLNVVVTQTKKAFCWLHAMATVDPASRRAFGMCDKVMRRIAPGLRIDLTDWPSRDTLEGGGGDADITMESLEELLNFEGSVSF